VFTNAQGTSVNQSEIGLTQVAKKSRNYFFIYPTHLIDISLLDKILPDTGNIDVTESESLSLINCSFIRDTSSLICKVPTYQIECKAQIVWNEGEEENVKYSKFGIEAYDESHSCYKLYPRSINNTEWIDTNYIVNRTENHISLFHANINNHSGIRVQNQQCFNKIVKFIILKTEF